MVAPAPRRQHRFVSARHDPCPGGGDRRRPPLPEGRRRGDRPPGVPLGAPADRAQMVLGTCPGATASGRPVSPTALPAPRLLADLHPAGAVRGAWQSLAEHRSRYAPPPPPRGRPLTEIIDLVEAAGLRARGGLPDGGEDAVPGRRAAQGGGAL